ncbi:hypothetical protein [Allonocardiopsis opalescens]|uniref:Uncharacterized protein n=1 Tax=Allonocardiopsis opalescens TaxID=1144618 RepID=A0A2T0Q065_9ACTN|nr:hypothetical protein [Allonocardiopsis opalescens]PRX97180.1 hypothetical protein CLV72_106216 [Allonocardiopsis opalescens]
MNPGPPTGVPPGSVPTQPGAAAHRVFRAPGSAVVMIGVVLVVVSLFLPYLGGQYPDQAAWGPFGRGSGDLVTVLALLALCLTGPLLAYTARRDGFAGWSLIGGLPLLVLPWLGHAPFLWVQVVNGGETTAFGPGFVLHGFGALVIVLGAAAAVVTPRSPRWRPPGAWAALLAVVATAVAALGTALLMTSVLLPSAAVSSTEALPDDLSAGGIVLLALQPVLLSAQSALTVFWAALAALSRRLWLVLPAIPFALATAVLCWYGARYGSATDGTVVGQALTYAGTLFTVAGPLTGVLAAIVGRWHRKG